MSSKLSKKDLYKEIIRCGRDPVYFLNTYARIQHPVRGLIPFKTYEYQNDIINAMNEHRMNIILKGRQLGVTTIEAGYIAWFILFHRDKNVLVVATKQETAKNMVRVVSNIFKYLPKWMLSIGQPKYNNRLSIELNNGSRVKAVTTSTDVGRSEAVSLLVVDEVAHIRNFDEIWMGLWPTVSTGGRVAVMSTPNGTGNWFHENYVQAKEKVNGFNCEFGTYVNPMDQTEVYNDRLMWWVHPDHDDTWFQAETAGKSPREIAQEYLCNFNASGDTFIFNESLGKLRREIKEPVHFFYGDRNVWIWKLPEPTGRYLISCDVSRGDAADFSAFHVIRLDVTPEAGEHYAIEQVAEYKGKIRPDQLGILLVQVSQFYNAAIIAPENNSGWSGQTILKIQEANYPHIYYSRKVKPKVRDGTLVDPYYAMNRNDHLPGYSVTSANRIAMLAKMEQYIRMRDIRLYSSRLSDELDNFIVTETGRPEATRGCNDDLVMALAGGLWVREEAFMYSMRTDEMAKAMAAGITVTSKNTQNFRDFNFETSMHDRGRIQQFVQNQNKMVMANGDVVDLNWLITSG